jgi:hypothetical protein
MVMEKKKQSRKTRVKVAADEVHVLSDAFMQSTPKNHPASQSFAHSA